MFDIGFPELLLVSIVALLVFGPERLPEVLRTVGGWLGSARRSFNSLKAEIEREVGADEIRRDLHNARIMEEAKQIERQMAASRDEVEQLLGRDYGRSKGAPEDGVDDTAGTSGAPEADADPGTPDAGSDNRIQPPGSGRPAPAPLATPEPPEAPAATDSAADSSTDSPPDDGDGARRP